jgi:hypothetical protein
MGVPISEVGYTSATTGRGDHEVHKGHVVALEKKNYSKNVIRRSSNVGWKQLVLALRFIENKKT